MTKRLHIVHFDIAYPPDYGGAIAEFYLLRALHEAGVQITLHAFQYDGREPADELEKFAEKVFYYPRPFFPWHLLSTNPYIVTSRRKWALFNNLMEDEAPILFDGLQSSAFISHPKLNLRKKLLRLHNIDWKYYLELGKIERNPIKALYYRLESGKLKEYESVACQHANEIICLSAVEEEYYRNQYLHVKHIPPAHPFDRPDIATGKGSYVLYHGNLAINDNEKAALYLCQEVFSQLKINCKIAGHSPGPRLEKACTGYSNIELIPDPDDRYMDQLIREAHVNVLFANQGAGIKMKLLHALYSGRFCLANDHVLSGSGLEHLCTIGNDTQTIISGINELLEKRFNDEELERRRQGLESYDVKETTKELLQLL